MGEHFNSVELVSVLLACDSSYHRSTKERAGEELVVESFRSGRLTRGRESGCGTVFSALGDVRVSLDGHSGEGRSLRSEDSEGGEAIEISELGVEFVGGDVRRGMAVQKFTVDVIFEDESGSLGGIGVSLSTGEETTSD